MSKIAKRLPKECDFKEFVDVVIDLLIEDDNKVFLDEKWKQEMTYEMFSAAIKHGIIVEKYHTEPCGNEHCSCTQASLPCFCYYKAYESD